MAQTQIEKVTENSLDLSANQLKRMVGDLWPDLLINDYLAQIRNIREIASDNTEIEKRVTENEQDIEDLQGVTDDLQNQVDANDQDILALQQVDASLQQQIDSNDQDIINLQQADNDLQNSIQDNEQAISTHVNSNSKHGVTGANVGTGDYAKTLTGGVVLLANLVQDSDFNVNQIVSADILGAPATYDQSHMQTVVDLVNEIKQNHNLIIQEMAGVIGTINEIISEMKTAKQMSEQ